MAGSVIQASGLVKRFGRGRDAKTALAGLDLSVDEGEVYGYLGPNGAGKTTTIRLMLDLIRPTAGEIRVFGASPRDNAGHPAAQSATCRATSSSIRDSPAASCSPTSGPCAAACPAARIDELAQRFDLDLTRRIGSLSKGNRQKVGLVQAFMHRPPLLVLDEPSSGLDPFLQQRFIELVRDASANGQTVFMSSHVLSEVQATCHRVGIIREGRLVTVANVDELRDQAQRRIEITFVGTGRRGRVRGAARAAQRHRYRRSRRHRAARAARRQPGRAGQDRGPARGGRAARRGARAGGAVLHLLRPGEPVMTVFVQYLRENRRGFAGWAVAITAVAAMYSAFWPVFGHNAGLTSAIDAFPQAMKDAFHMTDYSTPAGYFGSTVFGLLVPDPRRGLRHRGRRPRDRRRRGGRHARAGPGPPGHPYPAGARAVRGDRRRDGRRRCPAVRGHRADPVAGEVHRPADRQHSRHRASC